MTVSVGCEEGGGIPLGLPWGGQWGDVGYGSRNHDGGESTGVGVSTVLQFTGVGVVS